MSSLLANRQHPGAVDCKGHSWTVSTWWASTASCFLSSGLDYVLLLGPDNSEPESEADNTVKPSPTWILFTGKSRHNPPPKSFKPCGNGRMAKQQVEFTGSFCYRTFTNAALGCSLQDQSSSAVRHPPGVWPALFNPLLTSMAWGRGWKRRSKHRLVTGLLISKVGGDFITNHWHMECVYAYRQHQSWPERQTALTARELGRCNIHIAVLSETTFVWLHLFWTGLNSEERHEVGVGFALRTDAISKRTNLPKRFNNCLMTTPPLSVHMHQQRRIQETMINSTRIWKTSLKAYQKRTKSRCSCRLY